MGNGEDHVNGIEKYVFLFHTHTAVIHRARQCGRWPILQQDRVGSLIYLPMGLTECLYRFQVDPSSPDYRPTSEDDDSPDEDAEDEPCDYEIMSKTLK